MLTRSERVLGVLGVLAGVGLMACGAPAPAAPARPCFTIRGDSELRPKDAKKTLDELVQHILLAPEDEALRSPKSLADVKAILRRDTVYLFPNATAGGASEELPARRSDLVPPPTEATSLAIGKANIVDGRRIDGPLSFADKNAIRLRDLQDTLVRIMRPELLPAGSRADTASADDLAYVREALGTLPSASGLAGFDRNVVADYQLSPFLRGIERVRSRGNSRLFEGRAGLRILDCQCVCRRQGHRDGRFSSSRRSMQIPTRR